MHADGVRFEAKVAQENITLDQTVELTTLERDGKQVLRWLSSAAAAARPGAVAHRHLAADAEELGERPAVVRMVEQHQYIFHARKKGSGTIGPGTVRVAGQALHTKPILVHVAPIPKNAISPAAPPGSSRRCPPRGPRPRRWGATKISSSMRASKRPRSTSASR